MWASARERGVFFLGRGGGGRESGKGRIRMRGCAEAGGGRAAQGRVGQRRTNQKRTDLVDVGEHHEEHDAVSLLEALLEQAHPDHGGLGGEEGEDPPPEHLGEEASAALERRNVHVPR